MSIFSFARLLRPSPSSALPHVPSAGPSTLSLPLSSPAAAKRGIKMTVYRPGPAASSPSIGSAPRPLGSSSAGPSLGGAGANGANGASAGSGPAKNGYALLYREIFPAMIPILLISTTVFLSLSLVRTHLSHSLSLQQSSERIALLEEELLQLRRDQRRQIARERRERERILPMVVERVLQRVGVRGEDLEEEEEDKEEEKLLV